MHTRKVIVTFSTDKSTSEINRVLDKLEPILKKSFDFDTKHLDWTVKPNK